MPKQSTLPEFLSRQECHSQVSDCLNLVIDELAQTLPQEDFTGIKLELDKPKTLWVAAKEVEIYFFIRAFIQENIAV